MGRAEDMGVRHLQAIDQNLGMAAGHGAVERVDDALDLHRRMRQVHEEHRGARGRALTGARHDDADLGADRSGDEHLAAMDVPISAGAPVLDRSGHQHRRIGARTALRRRLRHEEGRALLAGHQGRQKALFLLRRSDPRQQEHVALVRRHGVDRHRPEWRKAGAFEHGSGLALAQVVSIRQDVRRQDACRTRQASQLQHQIFRGPMGTAAWIRFVRDDGLADEGFDPLGDLPAAFGGRRTEGLVHA